MDDKEDSGEDEDEGTGGEDERVGGTGKESDMPKNKKRRLAEEKGKKVS